MRCTSYSFISAKFSKLSTSYFYLWKDPSFKEKHSFKLLCMCWNVNDNCDVNVAIDCASYQFKKQQEKNYSSGFLCFFCLASLILGYQIIWYSSSAAILMELLISGQLAFTCAQRVILHSQDFNLPIESMQKIPFLILFNAKNYLTEKAQYITYVKLQKKIVEWNSTYLYLEISIFFYLRKI